MNLECWLKRFSDTPCDGQLVRCHLIPKQLLKREGHADYVDDYRTWVPGCGGPMGNAGHHGEMDFARKLRVPRSAIPTATELLASELGLTWYLDREYSKETS